MRNLFPPPHVRGSAVNDRLSHRNAKSTRIVIADEQPIFCQGLRKVIETQPDLRVVGYTSDGAEAVKLTRERTPGILLLDLAIPGLAGLEVLRKVQGSAPQVRTIILALEMEAPENLEALKLGACGVIQRDALPELLFKGIRIVMTGQYWVGREKIADILKALGNGTPADLNGSHVNSLHLTPRELQIISAILDGETNKAISKKFELSEDTVKHHLTHIFDKLGVGNRLELALFAMHRDLLGRYPAGHAQYASANSSAPWKSQ